MNGNISMLTRALRATAKSRRALCPPLAVLNIGMQGVTMDDIGKKSYEVHIAAAILALGIQNINKLSQEDIDKVYEYALDSLHKAGIIIEFSEIKKINKLPTQKAQDFVIKLKSRIIAMLQGSCGLLPSRIFELTFNLYLLSTTPEEIPNLTEYLKQLAAQIGIKNSLFSNALISMVKDVDVGLTEYESAVEKLLKKADETSFLDLFPMKPGIPGVISFDINMAIKRYQKWRKGKSGS
jgi:hypothetical protein